jgi:hypothetical protein
LHARRRALDRVVALKVIAPELAQDPLLRRRFVRESRLAASPSPRGTRRRPREGAREVPG